VAVVFQGRRSCTHGVRNVCCRIVDGVGCLGLCGVFFSFGSIGGVFLSHLVCGGCWWCNNCSILLRKSLALFLHPGRDLRKVLSEVLFCLRVCVLGRLALSCGEVVRRSL